MHNERCTPGSGTGDGETGGGNPDNGAPPPRSFREPSERQMKDASPQSSLRHLHPRVHRRAPRHGVQLARRPARGGAGLHRRARSTRAGSSSATATTTAASPAARMERPALQRLLRDVESGVIDVIVVYKVDRLSRSLTDFARIVEVFEKNNASFVSITQQFNTTTSMGRLTLNILLSFAQFEREVIGERIRDKFAASRRKGMWMGGIAAARLRRARPQAGGERDGSRARPADLQPVPAGRLGDEAGAGAAARRPHHEILDDAGRQVPAGQADRQGRDLQDPQQPRLPRRGGAQGHELSRRARGDHRSRRPGTRSTPSSPRTRSLAPTARARRRRRCCAA